MHISGIRRKENRNVSHGDSFMHIPMNKKYVKGVQNSEKVLLDKDSNIAMWLYRSCQGKRQRLHSWNRGKKEVKNGFLETNYGIPNRYTYSLWEKIVYYISTTCLFTFLSSPVKKKDQVFFFCHRKVQVSTKPQHFLPMQQQIQRTQVAQSVEGVEYTDYISAEG